MDRVADLVVAPFRDMVEKGTAAVANAGAQQPMLAAAQGLVKEGERALRRIKPLCKKHFDDYGFGFVSALVDSDALTGYRSELNDLLWGFDDYLDADGFDAAKYAQLQAVARRAAPRIHDLLMRMQLDAPPRDAAQHFMSQPSPPSSPLHPPPLQPGPMLHRPLAIPRTRRVPVTVSQVPSLLDADSVEDVTAQLQMLMGSQPFGHSHDAAEARASRAPPAEPEPEPAPAPEEHPPRPPSTNPWDPHVAPEPQGGPPSEYSPFQRRPTVCRPDSPVDWAISPLSPARESRPLGHRPPASISSGSNYDNDRRQSSSSVYSSGSIPDYGSLARFSRFTIPIPEEDPAERAVKPLPQPPQTRQSSVSSSQAFPSLSRRMSGESAASSGETTRHHHLVHVNKGPTPERPWHAPPFAGHDAAQGGQQPGWGASRPDGQPGLEVYEPVMPRADFESGLIPVDTEYSEERFDALVPSTDCTISASSSFSLHKGFCQGAKEVMRGDIGVKRAQKPVGLTLSRVVARCTGCLYEVDLDQIGIDVNNRDQGNLTKCGVGYRLRFLQKSHLATKRVDDVLYGCVFCVQQGRTLDESDSTVFFTTKALFNHLGRHPRPLPQVPGVIVIDGPEVPTDLDNNYDIHLKHPPVAHPAYENHAEIVGLARGVARDQSRRIYGQKTLWDRSPPLELARGARVTGIKWPLKYNGEWVFAWHDGVFASAPTDLIRLEPPPAAEIKLGGTSQVRAKARWKFAVKDKNKGDWLKFDKSETITNISWAYPEHWCWSGTNAKGKWGIFPQAFIDSSTLQDISSPTPSGRAGSLYREGSKTTVLSRLSLRISSGRPPSVAESTSSRETAATGFRLSAMISRGTNDGQRGGG